MFTRNGRLILFTLLVTATGCVSPAPAPTDTGARVAVQSFFDALIQQDWPRAYDTLHPDSKAAVSLEHFSTLAKNYYHHLGFQPTGVQVRSCEEHGDEAIAHVVLSGSGTGKSHHPYKDGATLRTTATGWGVVLSSQFGLTHVP